MTLKCPLCFIILISIIVVFFEFFHYSIIQRIKLNNDYSSSPNDKFIVACMSLLSSHFNEIDICLFPLSYSFLLSSKESSLFKKSRIIYLNANRHYWWSIQQRAWDRDLRQQETQLIIFSSERCWWMLWKGHPQQCLCSIQVQRRSDGRQLSSLLPYPHQWAILL